jgi:hypothetical protein
MTTTTSATTTSATTTSATTTSSPAERLRPLAGAQLARDGWSRDRLLDHQGERLRALITHAVAASPYYREVLGPDAASGDVPLQELPTLPKATLMDNFDRIVTEPGLRRADLEAHLAGPGADQPYLGRYRLFTTAGTTRLRGLFLEDADEFAAWIGTCLRGLACWGVGPATRLAGIGSPSPLHISNQVYAVLLAGQAGAAPRLAVTTPVPEMVVALNAFRRWSPPARRCRRPTCAGGSARPGGWRRSTSTGPPRRSSPPPAVRARWAWTSWRTWWSSRSPTSTTGRCRPMSRGTRCC